MKKLAFLLLFASMAASCARQGTLTGGQKDTTPPVMDTLRSSANYVTQFKDDKIKLTFNEYVVLADVTKEVVISPPLDPNPKITLKKKTVTVDLSESASLRPNTTYTINFGGAVRDLHEKNPAKDLRFVFSTGATIDSLEVEGVITDAITGDPVENITVMLYDNLADSAVLKEKKPYYFAKTDKGGLFSIKNVKPGTFQAIAVDEGQIGNLRWDRPDAERIGFPDSLVMLSDSVQRAVLLVSIFKNQGPLKKTTANADRYGIARILYSDKPENIPLRLSADTLAGFRSLVEYSKDTMLVWYDFPPDAVPAPWWLITGDSDTTRIKALARADFLLRHRVIAVEESGVAAPGSGRGGQANKPLPPPKSYPIKTIQQTPGKKAILRWNTPINAIDTAKWIVTTADSMPFRQFSILPDSASLRALQLSGDWKPGAMLKFVLLPGAVTGFYGVTNVDTFSYQINLMTEKQLGVLNLTVENTKPGENYVLEILNGTVKEHERRFTATSPATVFQFKEMIPGNYTAKIIIDRNGNGRWDTGSFFQKRQPEIILTKKLDALRANWELEATISAKKDDGKRK